MTQPNQKKKTALLAIDQGTTSTRAIVFDAKGHKLGTHQVELPQSFPKPGWVEHDALRIRDDAIVCTQGALKAAKLTPADIAGIGITNQRETAVIWDRKSGKPIHPAIVWQDRRTADFCAKHADRSEWLGERTGLLLDPYFSATKIAWMLENVDGARARADKGELAFGTIDCWLLWCLTGGKVHATDASNAARTALFNLRTQDWDDELLRFFKVPRALLPEVMDCAAEFGDTAKGLFDGAMPIRGMLGDQQAATVGQACFAPGMIKSTYGTGCFIVLNTGEEIVRSRNKLLSTVAYRFEGKTTYALEGSIFVAGAAVQWLRDAVHLVASAGDTEKLARSIKDTEGVYLVPAFTGLGAPYWDPQARGAILGLTRNSGIAHIVRAALESVCYQTRDLLGAMREDAVDPTELRIDGGMVVNDFVAQSLADILQVNVVRPATVETTALGAAFAAGLQAGVYDSLGSISKLWEAEAHFKPKLASARADAQYQGWREAVSRVRTQQD